MISLLPWMSPWAGVKLLSVADLSWLVGIVVAGGLYLALGRRVPPVAVPHAMRGNR